MLEIAILTCLEATLIIERVKNNDNLDPIIKQEVIIELINRSNCEDGNV